MAKTSKRDDPATDTPRRRVLDYVVDSPDPLTVAQIVEATELHANTVRSHLALLVDMGRVESVSEHRTVPGRPKLLYRAVPEVTAHDPYRTLAAELAAGPDAGRPGDTPGLAAGRRLARAQREKAGNPTTVTPDESIDLAIDGLEVLGFEATTDPLGDRLYLPMCPFLEMARKDRSICRVHHEMLTGFFGEIDAGVQVRQLDIFVKGDLCVVQLDRPDIRPAPVPALEQVPTTEQEQSREHHEPH